MNRFRPQNFVTHRQWTAEEAIGKCVIFDGDDEGWIQITATDSLHAHGYSCLGRWRETYEMLLDRYIEKDKGMCGIPYQGEEMTNEELMECRNIAYNAHKGQTRKFGDDKDKSYIIHPERMASKADSNLESGICWLHDVIEDTEVTRFDLLDLGVSEDIVIAVESVTKIDGEEYVDFILRAKQHIVGRAVKILDINDNLLSLENKGSSRKSLRDKYLLALFILKHDFRPCL